MSTARDARSMSQRFLEVTCSCGRTLRAPIEMAGSTIQCWDCKRQVPVPLPQVRRLAFRVLWRGLGEVFKLSVLGPIAAGALVLTVLLIVPLNGVVQALLVLGLAGIGYGELIRRGEMASIGTTGKVVRGILTVVIASLGMVPWFCVPPRLAMGRPPTLTWVGIAVGVVLGVVVPLALVALWAPKPWKAVQSVLRHPIAALATLLVLPVGLALVELVAIGITSWLGMLSFYVVDLYPDAIKIHSRFGISNGGNYTALFFVDRQHFRMYEHHLTHGIPLTIALPASLAQTKHVSLSLWSIDRTDEWYVLVRAAHTLIILAGGLLVLAVQGLWLGLVARLDDPFASPSLPATPPRPDPSRDGQPAPPGPAP